MNKNYHPNKKKTYLLIFGLLLLSFLLVFGGLIFRNVFHHDYPLVFVDSNNRLMYITKSDNNKNDIASIENANIVYANNDTKLLLYTNNNVLYLLNTTIGGMGTEIVESPIKYGFSNDDKYVFYLDSNNTFFLYNIDSANVENIADNVSKVEIIKNDYVLYKQDDKLVYYNLGSDESTIISDSYKTVELNSDNKLILYSILNNDLSDYYVYNINSQTNKLVLSQIDKLYDKDSNYVKFLYTRPSTTAQDIGKSVTDSKASADKQFEEYSYSDYTSKKITKAQYEANQSEKKNVDLRNKIRDYLDNYLVYGDSLYYQNGTNSTLVKANINKLYYYDIKNQIYSYTTDYWESGAIDISSYSDIDTFYSDLEAKKLNSMYFKSGTSDESMAYKNITSKAKIYIQNGNEFYLIVADNDYYNLYYSSINNKQIKLVGEIDTNLLSNKLITDYADGFLYCNYINGRYYLNMIQNGNVKTVAEDVNSEYVEVSEGKDSIYYIKTTGDNVGDLMLYNGIRTSKVTDSIYSLLYINNDLMYVTKNYDAITKTSDLYRLANSHLTLIYKNIADWYSPLKATKNADTEEQIDENNIDD